SSAVDVDTAKAGDRTNTGPLARGTDRGATRAGATAAGSQSPRQRACHNHFYCCEKSVAFHARSPEFLLTVISNAKLGYFSQSLNGKIIPPPELVRFLIINIR